MGTFACDEECPCFHSKSNLKLTSCRFELLGDALDLINRLQAENEDLKTENLILSQKRFNIFERVEFFAKVKEKAKAEAYKEFAERLKDEIAEALKSNYKARAERIEKHNVGETDEFISYCGGKIDCLRGLDDFLDDLLKELVGDSGETVL